MNYAFGQVIEGCASDREEGTWITRGVVEAYHRLHELGHAHSIEVWREDELVGGMYGVAQERYFVASPCSAGWKMRLKRRFWYSVRIYWSWR